MTHRSSLNTSCITLEACGVLLLILVAQLASETRESWSAGAILLRKNDTFNGFRSMKKITIKNHWFNMVSRFER